MGPDLIFAVGKSILDVYLNFKMTWQMARRCKLVFRPGIGMAFLERSWEGVDVPSGYSKAGPQKNKIDPSLCSIIGIALEIPLILPEEY